MRDAHTSCASERGAAAVEFAFIVPLLIVLVLGIAEFGRAFQVQGTLSAAAREGVRVMALQNDQAAARTAVRDAATSLDPTITDAEIAISPRHLPHRRRRHHLGAPDHQLPDALPHRLLRLGHRPHRKGSHAMQRLTSLFRAPARRGARRHRGDLRAAAGADRSASRPSPSTSARSTPTGPSCRWPPTPPRSPSRSDCALGNCGDMLATAQQPGARQRRPRNTAASPC